jgi:tetratricopeptide (TPR) repeat protein
MRSRPSQPYLEVEPDRQARQPYWLLFALIPFALAIGLYLNSLSNGFTYDDFNAVVQNGCVTGAQPLARALESDVWCLRGQETTGSYRPLTLLLLRAIHGATGLSAFGYHAVSVGLYGLVTLLVFALALRVAARLRVAFLAALLFAVHPVHTEAVDSISAMGDLLAALFGFGAVLVYAGLLIRPDDWWRRLAAIPLMAAAILSKESAVTLFGVLAFLDLWRLSAPTQKIFTKAKAVEGGKILLPWLVMALVLVSYLGLRYFLFGRLTTVVFAEDNPLSGLPLGSYLPTAFAALGEYLRLLLVPLRLSVDYSFNQIPVHEGFSTFRTVWPALALLGSLLLAGYLVAVRRWRSAFALAFIWITLSIASNLLATIPTIVAERLLLMPSFGVCLLAALVMDALMPRSGKRARMVAVLVLTILFAALGFRTVLRNADWHDNLTLFKAAAETTPNSRKVHVNLGWWLRNEGRYTEALTHYRRADAIGPQMRDAFLDRELGLCYHGMGNFSQAIFHYERAQRRAPREDVLRILLREAKASRIPADLRETPRHSTQSDPPPPDNAPAVK